MSQDSIENSIDELAPKRSLWAFALPYLLAIWCCLGILQRSPTDIPPAEILIPTIIKILLVIGLVHLVLAMLIRRTPAREMILLTMVSFVGFFGSARTLFVYAYCLTNESTFLGIWFAAHALMVCVCFCLNLTKPLENIALAMGVSAASMVAYQAVHISLPMNQDLAQLESLIQKLNDESPLESQTHLHLTLANSLQFEQKSDAARTNSLVSKSLNENIEPNPTKGLAERYTKRPSPFLQVGAKRIITKRIITNPLRSADTVVAPGLKPTARVGITNLPDIYYIIVDAYARQDILEQVYGFNNQPFLDSLRDRGFYVGDQSRSNYNMTEFSMASSLNMRHLDGLGLTEFKTRLPMRELIRQNLVTSSLKESGYTTIAFETGKSETECNNFDQYIPFGKALCDYQDVLYHGTPLPALFEMTGAIRSAARRHGDRVLFMFDRLPSVAQKEAKPAFVFCHMLAPHPPFLFGSDGQEIDVHGHYLLADWVGFTSRFNFDLNVYRDAYRDQVAFINEKLIQMVDAIQQSNRSSIIIIQGDHGPRMGFGHRRDQWESCEWRYRESFSILNAICMHEDARPTSQSMFYPAMTPVNTFRIIFNELFDSNLQMESDASYHESKYTFADLTKEALPLPVQPKATDQGKLTLVSVVNKPLAKSSATDDAKRTTKHK